ncbi:MAG: hypothetical protein QOI08_2494 [Actinomycetota bacterium]|nr:hypothetical protein [Actinomycetota bacterium]
MSSEEPLAGGNVGAVVRVGSPVGARTLTATSGVRNSSGPASGTKHGTASGTATNTRGTRRREKSAGRDSAALELGAALLREGSHAFLEIVARERSGLQLRDLGPSSG